MKRLCSQILVAAALLLSCSLCAVAAPPIPPMPTEWVTDTVGFLSDSARQAINTQLEAYEQSSKHQVLVYIGKSTGDDALEDFTVRSFKAWRVGRKGLDDGLVLFVFSDDHTARIEVGYGLEGVATDSATSEILRNTVLSKIKAGDHDGAISGGVNQILNLISPGAATTAKPVAASPPAASTAKAAPAQPMPWYEVLLLVLAGIGFILLAIRHPMLAYFLLSLIGRNGGGGGGGFRGGGGQSGGGGASGKW